MMNFRTGGALLCPLPPLPPAHVISVSHVCLLSFRCPRQCRAHQDEVLFGASESHIEAVGVRYKGSHSGHRCRKDDDRFLKALRMLISMWISIAAVGIYDIHC